VKSQAGLPDPFEWIRLSPIQRVQRVALLELATAEEWVTLGDIFSRRGVILEWREKAA